jgi:hypothetical protein
LADTTYPDWPLPVLNAEFNHAPSLANSIGDFMYWDAVNQVVKPANALADLGSAVLMQNAFARLFMGVARSKQLATDAVPHPARLGISLVAEFPCVSSTFVVGDYVGLNYAAAALAPQQLVKVAAPNLAVGRVVKAYAVATTKVKAWVMSRYLLGLPDRYSTIGSGQGSAGAASVLTDDNLPVTVDLGPFLVCTPSGNRTKALPLETTAGGMEFYFANLSGTNTVTFTSSAGAAIAGNGAVPLGKSAQLWCDGVRWAGLVSA